jgi:hypothetical protein
VSVLAERLLALHEALTQAGVPHALGGAFALGYCTLQQRATTDVDVNMFVVPVRAREVLAALPQGVAVTDVNVVEAERDGQVRVWWDAIPVDVFFDVLPFHSEVARTVRHVAFAGLTVPVVSCNTLAVFKAMFDRPKHWADIEAMVEAKSLEFNDALARVREMAGADSAAAEQLAALQPD